MIRRRNDNVFSEDEDKRFACERASSSSSIEVSRSYLEMFNHQTNLNYTHKMLNYR